MPTAAFDWDNAALCGQFEHPVTKRLRASNTPGESGHVIGYRVWDTELRQFELNWPNAHEGHKFLLLDYWRKARTNTRFTYTPQDGSGVVDAKFARRPTFIQNRHGNWSLSAVLEEVK